MSADRVSIFDSAAIDRLGRELKIDPQRIRRARTLYFKKSRPLEAALADLPEPARTSFAESISPPPLQLYKQLESDTGQATKLLFKNADGYALEAVILRPTTGRIALCVSSQVGCAAACRFCATGHMGVAKDLTADEILAQVTIANEVLRTEVRRVRNIVFMGMGEPFHNAVAVEKALAALQDPALFDHASSRLLVSTVGIPDQLIAFGERFPTVNFALSLHSADPAKRERIIPLARRYSVDALRQSVAHLNRLQPAKTTVMIEHLMLDDLNDTDADCDKLLQWADGLRVHFNLIPFNPIEDARELRSSPRHVIEEFAAKLKSRGFPTTIRHSLGSDIDAACGQLVRAENRKHAQLLSSASG